LNCFGFFGQIFIRFLGLIGLNYIPKYSYYFRHP